LLELRAWPAGWVEGGLLVSRGDELPSSLALRFEASPEATSSLPQSPPKSAASCPVSASRFRCKVPAASLDLKLVADGFVPLYFWGRPVQADAEVNLGSLYLRSGSSVVGWVERPADATDFAWDECSVELSLAVAPYVDEVERERFAAVRATARVNERGFFQVLDVAPGRYSLTVKHEPVKHEAFAPARATVQVAEGTEVELGPMSLERLATLTLRIDYQTDPYLEPWEVKLYEPSSQPGFSQLAAGGTASPEGHFQAAGLTPGTYSLSVATAEGATWHREAIEVFPGETTHDVSIKFRRLEGHVTIGGEPVPSAEVIFREVNGERQISHRTNAEGRFYAFLAHGGVRWDLTIQQPELDIVARFEDFRVRRRHVVEEHAVVDFEIPDTTVEGQVLYGVDQQPVPGAMVRVSLEPGAGGVEYAGPDGSFRIRGIEPGELQLRAYDEPTSRRSQVHRVVATAGAVTDDVTLFLGDDLRVLGRVVAAGEDGSPSDQGVSGAEIVANLDSLDGRGPSSFVPRTLSDIDGVFELALPPGTRGAWLTILPPGFAVTQRRIETPSDEPMLVPVVSEGGTLKVRYPEAITRSFKPSQFERLKQATVVVQHALLANRFSLGSWARGHGVSDRVDALEIPMLEPGRYLACHGEGPASHLERGAELPPELRHHCVSGELAPYGELELTVPAVGVRSPGRRSD
ncbi:MAG: carboxypeptidase-like regulatory domain-containing protein, partial [Acidobacteriota bacterium]